MVDTELHLREDIRDFLQEPTEQNLINLLISQTHVTRDSSESVLSQIEEIVAEEYKTYSNNKKPQVLNYYEVGDAYDAEGRGSFTVIANFFSEELAEKYSEKRGNYTNKAKVNKKILIICSTIKQIEQANKEERKAKALNKLTKEERELLGLELS